ncbi:hypothetical protein DPMN_136527 [Dreissena polymorpha]|uniref:Uncharacterized protein n=1 Tax=Dreissena polymorpha TaxID=45954 RepID=A0A9D4JCR5_DREPO|nr:hypothetical protein DPMN_136527 [Dreissena polymorpha]
MESHVSLPRVSVPILTSTHVSTARPNLSTNTSSFNSQAPGSSVHLDTTTTFSAPRVSSLITSRIPPSATASDNNTLWIQQSPGHLVPIISDSLPVTASLHNQFADFVSDQPSSPDISILVQDNDPMTIEADGIHSSGIPTSSSTDYIQTTDLAGGSTETGAESNVEAESYLASINQVYEIMFHTLGWIEV